MASGHKITYMKRSEFDHTARCQCGWTPDPRKTYRTLQMVEDEVRGHLEMVQRVKLHITGKHTSLTGERDHAKKMMDDPSAPAKDRETWRILYTDLAARCGHKPTPEEEPELDLGIERLVDRKPSDRT